MLKWLLKKSKRGGIGGFFAGLLAAIIGLLGMAIGFFASIFFCMWVEDVVGNGLIVDIAIFLTLPTFMMLPFYFLYKANKEAEREVGKPYVERAYRYSGWDRGDRHTGNRELSELRIVLGKDKIPFYDDLLDKKQKKFLLEEEIFRGYKYKTLEVSDYIQLSIGGKWISIGGYLLPTDFICGYSKHNNEIYSIDGATFVLPAEAKKPEISRQIENYFEEHGKYLKTVPTFARYFFSTFVKNNHLDLKMADWSKIRYYWEKEFANSRYGKTRKFKAQVSVFERVLSSDEILKIIAIIENHPEKLKAYTDFSSYKNEFCVCNGIDILAKLKYPENAEGIDFLFECLRDVDEAYFLHSMWVFRKIPKDVLAEKIEANAKAAFEKGNVQRLAGVMYLAKEIDYEIEFVKHLKGEIPEQEYMAGVTVEAAENAVKEFRVDDEIFYGSDEVMEFDAAAAAYAYEEKEAEG